MGEELRAMIEAIASRGGAAAGDGIATALSYIKGLGPCLDDARCAEAFFGLGTMAQWEAAVKTAAGTLVYSDPDCLPIGGAARWDIKESGLVVPQATERPVHLVGRNHRLSEALAEIQGAKRGKEPTPGAIMDFDCVLTSTRQDRDGDVLESSGADVDSKMPLLWQHIPMAPIGRHVGVLAQNSKRVTTSNAIADVPLGRDAAVLVEFGALRISHGFRPTKFEPLEKPKGKDGENQGPRGYHVHEFKVMEVSLVSIPSNEDATITAFSRAKLHHPLVKAWARQLWDARPTTVKGGWDPDREPAPYLMKDVIQEPPDDDPDKGLEIVADIIIAVLGDEAEEWAKAVEPCRDDQGRFAPCGGGGFTASEREGRSAVRYDQAKAMIDDMRRGTRPVPKEAVARLAGHLQNMTISQLSKLRDEHGFGKASGKLKADVVAKLTNDFHENVAKSTLPQLGYTPQPAEPEPAKPPDQSGPKFEPPASGDKAAGTTVEVEHSKGYSGRRAGKSYLAEINGTDPKYGLTRDFKQRDGVNWDGYNPRKGKGSWIEEHDIPGSGGVYEHSDHGDKTINVYYPARKDGAATLLKSAAVSSDDLKTAFSELKKAGHSDDGSEIVKAMSSTAGTAVKGVLNRVRAYIDSKDKSSGWGRHRAEVPAKGGDGADHDKCGATCPCQQCAAENAFDEEASFDVNGAKPYANEHSCRVNDPGKYDKFRRQNKKDKQGRIYGLIFGHLKSGDKWELQALRFKKTDWSADDARKACKNAGGTFEPAAAAAAEVAVKKMKKRCRKQTRQLAVKGRVTKGDLTKLGDAMEHCDAAAGQDGCPKMAKNLLGKASDYVQAVHAKYSSSDANPGGDGDTGKPNPEVDSGGKSAGKKAGKMTKGDLTKLADAVDHMQAAAGVQGMPKPAKTLANAAGGLVRDVHARHSKAKKGGPEKTADRLIYLLASGRTLGTEKLEAVRKAVQDELDDAESRMASSLFD